MSTKIVLTIGELKLELTPEEALAKFQDMFANWRRLWDRLTATKDEEENRAHHAISDIFIRGGICPECLSTLRKPTLGERPCDCGAWGIFKG